MNGLLLWIGGLLVAVLGLLFAAPYVVDWNAYRGVFEEEASRVLGRDVRVGGQVNLRLLPSPYVRFEKVRISDAGAALGEPFFRAEAFTLWLAPTPLLKGAIEASELELDRPVLRLAVDAEGRGNWQALRVTPGSVPFVPSEVVLQQVRIRNGLVSLRTPGVSEPLTLSGIDGEVSAASLDGPYRFRGNVDWYGVRQELRIGTAQREPDGKLRYKASVRSSKSGNLYSIDGMLSELSAKARHTGTLVAKLPLATVFGGLMAADGRSRASSGNEVIDLKASLEGDLDGAKLSDMSFAFEQNGKPQLVNGALVASWRNGLKIETQLASRWLDLDQIVGQDAGKAAPVETVRRLLAQASSMLPHEGTSLLTIDVDQVNLGGEAVSGVRLALARSGGLTSIGELRAALPGNARGELRGALSGGGQPGDPVGTLEGDLLLRGTSYQRVATWAGIKTMAAGGGAGGADAAFSIASRIRLSNDGLSLTDTRLEIGLRQMQGAGNWRWGSEPGLEISATGRAIDISAVASGALDLLHPQPGNEAAGTGSVALSRLAERIADIEKAVGSLRLRLRSGELSDGGTVLRDVDADVTVKSGGLTITGLRFTGSSGARIDLQGTIGELRATPTGTLRGWAGADTAAGVSALLDVLPSGARAIAGGWLAQASRAELGFTLAMPATPAEPIALSVDGLVDGARSVVDIRLGGGFARWREAPIAVALDLEGAPAERLLRRPFGENARAAPGTPGLGNVVLQVRAAGANAASLVTTARLGAGREAVVSNVEYKGRIALTGQGDVELAGEAMVAATANDLLMMTGANTKPSLAGVAVKGKLDVERKARLTTASTHALEVGGSRVGGRMSFTAQAQRTRIEGQLSTDRLALAGLMGLVLDADQRGTREDVEAARGASGPSPWPDAPFALELLDGTEGQIVIAAGSAALTSDLELSDAEVRLGLSPGKLELQALTGAALGGRITVRGTIDKATAGANVSLDARLTGGQLARLVAAGAAAGQSGSGDANVALSLSARALSPRAAMATASGKGEIELRNARIQGIATALVEKAALAAMDSSETLDRAMLERIVAAERGRSQTVIGNRKLLLDIVDGAVRIGALEIASAEATLRNLTTVDLVQLKADSEWQIVPRRALPASLRSGGSARGEPLPPMTIVWTGPLGAIGRAEPRLSVDQLEREISIRKLERDAERLEELRKQDEERARAEMERQRQLSGSETGPGSNIAPVKAPIIEAPLPISPPASGQNTPAGPVTDGSAPPTRVIRPPGPRPRSDAKSVQDMLMGQQ